jgi:hypothetical protein
MGKEQPVACPIFPNAERIGSEKTMGNIFFICFLPFYL